MLESGRVLKGKSAVLVLGVPGKAAGLEELTKVPEKLCFHSDDKLGWRLGKGEIQNNVLVIVGVLKAV